MNLSVWSGHLQNPETKRLKTDHYSSDGDAHIRVPPYGAPRRHDGTEIRPRRVSTSDTCHSTPRRVISPRAITSAAIAQIGRREAPDKDVAPMDGRDRLAVAHNARRDGGRTQEEARAGGHGG